MMRTMIFVMVRIFLKIILYNKRLFLYNTNVKQKKEGKCQENQQKPLRKQ